MATFGASLHTLDVLKADQGIAVDAQQTVVELLFQEELIVLVGGLVADRYGPRIATAVSTLVSAGVLLVWVGSYELPFAVILVAITLSGILQGLLLPSRDLLIRAVTPQGSMGKVLGFLTTGMMLAAAAVQPVFGWLMDIQEPRWVFWLSAIFVVAGLFCFAGASSTADEKQPA